MREESHLDDMRSAIRGDFERLAERRGGQELMVRSEQEQEQEKEHKLPEDDGALEHDALEPAPLVLDEDVRTDDVEDDGANDPGPIAIDSGEEPPRRSLLDRLLGR